MSNVLNPTQIGQYRERGYVFPVPALTPGEAADYRQAIEDFERRTGLAAGHVIRNKGHLKPARLYNLIFHLQVLDAVESVIGPDILCWGSSLFVKEAHDPGFVAWHQDSYYWGLEPDDVDESKAVDITLAPGEMSLHHVKILHGSPPNRSAGRRMGYAIRYVAPHVKQRGDMNSATLVRGEDRYGYFAKDPVPVRDMDPDIVAFVDRRYGGKPLGVASAAPNRPA